MFFQPCPTRSDHGNRELIGQGSKRLVRITGLHPIMVHARKQDFACSTLLSLFGPCQQFFIGFDTPAVQITLPAVFCLLGIYCQNTNLRTEVLGNVINQLRVANGGRIDRDLIRSGIQQAIYIAQFIDATAHGKRDIDIGSNPLYQFRESLTSFMTCSNIQKHKFICSLFAVSPPQLYRITGLAQIDKVRSFYGLSVFYIQTGYDSFC